MKKHHRRFGAFLIFIAIAIPFLIWGNRSIVTTEFSVSSSGLPPVFEGLRIVQVSDLHNTTFGGGNRRLLNAIKEAEPDLIFLTGDLLDSRRTDVQTALNFVREAVKLAPVYYVVGNHEGRIPEYYLPMEEEMVQLGVQVLRNRSVPLEREGQKIYIAGIDDPEFFPSQEDFLGTLNELCDDDSYTLLLSHRPELLDAYAEAGAEFVFSGHAHGGQIRLPWVGGLYAPHQGTFPSYDAGMFTKNETCLLVSRGLGNSIFPLRLFNRPELIVAELIAKP